MSLDIDRIETSFRNLSPHLEELTRCFYDHLFANHPEVAPLFEMTDLVRQRRKMSAMLTLIVTNLRRMDVLVSVLRVLGAQHVAYQATPESYRWVQESMVHALADLTGDAWDDQTASAWNEAIALISAQMLEGANVNADIANPSGADKDDLEILMEIAANPALSFQKDSLFSSYVQKRTTDLEMDLARTVQQSLIPNGFPELDEYQCAAFYEPAMHVGGDYYDWIMPSQDSLCLIFGDVSGKGVPGALIMCRLAGMARAILDIEDDATKALASINEHMCDRMPAGRFVTLTLLKIDLKTHQYSLVNAGHQPPILHTAAQPAKFMGRSANGIPIGISKDAEYTCVQGTFHPGDTLILYTDGVDEAMNTQGEQFGMDNLIAAVANESNPIKIGAKILNDVRHFAGARPQNDDITILTLSRK